MPKKSDKNSIVFSRDDDGLHWRVSLAIHPTRTLQAEGVISASEGFTPERESRAAITAIRKQLQEWEQVLKYA
jgi:hypothetical protein